MRNSLKNSLGRRIRLSWCGVIAAAIIASPGEAAADILTCIGPTGKVLYSNLGCPAGYALRESTAEAGAPAPAPAPAAATAEPLPLPDPAPSPRVEELVDEKCSVGTFRTEEAPGAIEVHFTNSGPRPCRRVRFYCLWGLGFGVRFYQQSRISSYEGLIAAGATVRVGEMTPTGPGATDVSWSWCSIR